MKKIIIFLTLLSFHISMLFSESLKSPGGKLELNFYLDEKGSPIYNLNFKNIKAIKESKLGFKLKNFENFYSGFKLEGFKIDEKNEIWTPVWGHRSKIKNNYKELTAILKKNFNDKILTLKIIFRLFDDGLAFRYEFGKESGFDHFQIIDEDTEFNIGEDLNCFWLPGDYDSQEYFYEKTRLSEIDAEKKINEEGSIFTRSFINKNAVQTPFLLTNSNNKFYMLIHEAALVDYPVMHLIVDRQKFILKSHLTPSPIGDIKAFLQAPFSTPWRAIIISDKAQDIASSDVILNLNDPCSFETTDWIKPQKYVGVWWEMHIGRSTWNYSDERNLKLETTDWKSLKPNGKHGANTDNVIRYIDFAAKHNFDAVLIEGWNVGWEDWFGNWKEDVFDFITPYSDFDLKKIVAYAKSKGVKLIMHHETSASVSNYERRMEQAFDFMLMFGYETVKTGYVGWIIPRGERHDGQWMTNHYLRVVKKAAEKKIMVNSHESQKPTGLHRTYPNWLSSEAARGNEFNAWSRGNPPEHETILPFTRLVGGPMDYTPGIFEIKLNVYDPNKKEQVHTTLAKQLALYVVIYSPLQMAADLPENYEKYIDAFQFIKDVPVDWDETIWLDSEPGEYVVVARKDKKSNNWFIGAITNEKERVVNIDFKFLNNSSNYKSKIYCDTKDAHYLINPKAYEIKEKKINVKSKIEIWLAPGGGAAISLFEIK